MTDRNTAKIRRSNDAKPARKPVAGRAAAPDAAQLRAELATARARIAELEQKQAEIVNRIDWVIDSLHNLPE